MQYKFQPFKQSNATKEARRTAKNDEKTVRNFYKTGYSQGLGGYGTQIGTAESRLNDLYNNNNLSSTFNYSRQSNYDTALSNLENREAFKYDINEDQLFQQAKEQYMQMGKTAMADTIGQASAMTGGYGNSYAVTAGAQAYNAHIQQLNNSIGDYYSMALNAYNSETNRLQGVVSALQSDRSLEANEWKSAWDVYNNLYSTYSNDLNNLRQLDQSSWKAKGEGLASVAGISANRAQNYHNNDYNIWNSSQQHKQTQAQQDEQRQQNQWQRNYQERQLQEQIRQNNWQRSQSQSKSQSSNSSGSKKKTKLTNKQRNNNVNSLISDITRAVKQANGGSLASKGKSSEQTAQNIANTYINKAISSGILDSKGAKQVRQALGL